LADLEPAAHAEYVRAKANPGANASEMQDAMTALRSQFPDLSFQDRMRKLGELYPKVLSQYKLEQAVSNPRFEREMQNITVAFPDLGFEGRWEKMKALNPELFWQFVLDAGSKSEEAS
jgi:hypothetical protein